MTTGPAREGTGDRRGWASMMPRPTEAALSRAPYGLVHARIHRETVDQAGDLQLPANTVPRDSQVNVATAFPGPLQYAHQCSPRSDVVRQPTRRLGQDHRTRRPRRNRRGCRCSAPRSTWALLIQEPGWVQARQLTRSNPRADSLRVRAMTGERYGCGRAAPIRRARECCR